MVRFIETPTSGLEQAYEGTLIHEETSAFQHIAVYEHSTFGKMLVLDGLVQTSINDEFFYHEMLVHTALIAHPEPKSVLIIGGGDGGTLRRVLEHPTIERAVMIEIDGQVTAVSRKFLPEIAGSAFEDPRAAVMFDDGNAYVRSSGERFDAIIIDSSDPVGPGIVLFSTDFYRACLDRLNPDGVLSAQIGSPLYFPKEIQLAITNAREAFPTVEPYLGAVPTYPGTVWAYMLCGANFAIDSTTAGNRAAHRGITGRYWNPFVHEGAFGVPSFLEGVVAGTSLFPAE